MTDRESGWMWLLGIFVAVVILGMIAQGPTPSPEQRRAIAAAAVQIDKSAEAQAGRKALIAKLIREGVFQKVEVPGNLPRLWVRPGFHALDFDQKKTFVAVVYAYYFAGSKMTDSVLIYDSLTGKEIGIFNPHLYSNGGLKLE